MDKITLYCDGRFYCDPQELIQKAIFEPNSEFTFRDGTYFVNRTDATLVIEIKEIHLCDYNCKISRQDFGYSSYEQLQLGERYEIVRSTSHYWETETRRLSA